MRATPSARLALADASGSVVAGVTARRRGGGRPRRVIGMRLIVTSTTVALITAAVVSAGGIGERNTRRALTREIEARLLLEARNLALTSAGALLSDYPELALVPVIRQMEKERPELAFVIVLDHRGILQGHADVRRLGQPYVAPPGLVAAASATVLHGDERLLVNGRLMVVETPVANAGGPRLGTAVVALERVYLDRTIAAARRNQFMFLVGLLAAGVALAMVVMTGLLRPIGALRAGLERIGRGDLDTPVRLDDRTELGLLADAVNDMASRLQQGRREAAEKERLAHEVELARDLQQRLLPRGPIVAGDCMLLGAHRAAAEVGGDYYDFLPLADGRVAIAIADVSGKGLGGCLVMTMLAALLRARREAHRSPAALLVELETQLAETLKPGEFVTMFYGLLDPRSARLVYASAGHMPLLVQRAGGQTEWLRTRGIPIGAMRGGTLATTLEDRTVELGRGDLLLQFTDGLSEAFDAAGEAQFGFDRIEDVVRAHAAEGGEAVLRALERAVREWSGGEQPLDDETLLVVVRGRGAGERRLADLDPLALVAAAEATGVALTLAARLEDLAGLGRWLATCPDLADLDYETLHGVEMAVYEACANVAEHGLRCDAARRYDLWWVPAPPDASSDAPAGIAARVRLGYFVLRDRGFPFSPGRWRPRTLEGAATWTEGRGLGLDILHRTMREVVYRPGTPAGNLTFMRFDPGTAPLNQ